MPTQPRTVRIVSLRCVQAQEIDGDEIYLTTGDHTLWSTGPLRMSEQMADDEQIAMVDFVNGTVQTRQGWIPMADFNPDDYTLPVGDGIRIQVKERDLLLGDDLIGQIDVVPADAPHGQIERAFVDEGAHYVLTFEVE